MYPARVRGRVDHASSLSPPVPVGLFANQSGTSSSSHVRGHLPTADGERAHAGALAGDQETHPPLVVVWLAPPSRRTL
eukprot:scaffold6198_cov36-Phaeocystis_antarctica.AAC.2